MRPPVGQVVVARLAVGQVVVVRPAVGHAVIVRSRPPAVVLLVTW
ncbi:hypothetical protein [Nonomuraea soli]|uniref:Oxalate decarboxylase/phosphoglucose isomerase-like protein (Cupin superfamily) n=1 Tax=Nonomuraea soli TaxID=1032476 RepID=A0A7W0CPC7_9ACTN|nr:hypothetical protein [Nonomuraea soli]MBA2894768.1 oxalate decarboxylase/phosphoglucose isomerase-like protein (cupin superfamily) [Nonomuraea soli]